MVMLNPPWALPFVALLGVPPFRTAHFAWLAVSLVLEAVSSIALWRYFGGEKSKQWIALVLFATFLPLGSAEHMGQITPLVLAGLTAFLFLLRRQRYLLAGACLLTLGLKPHLLYLVLLALLLWTIQTKRWSLAVSAIFFYASSTLAVIAFNHNVLDYFHGTIHAAMDTSCGVGGVLRSIFGVQHAWLQFLPTAIGTAWFARYWIRNRRRWTWEEHLPLVLLVSLGMAPYSWAHDYILALPSFVALTVAISRTRTDWLVASGLYLVVQYFISNEAGLLSNAWMAAASLLWLVLYLIGTTSLARTLPERAAQG
jgi:glucan phosphoethanolaminetransferase (alkaline phosphatase superfamily)